MAVGGKLMAVRMSELSTSAWSEYGSTPAFQIPTTFNTGGAYVTDPRTRERIYANGATKSDLDRAVGVTVSQRQQRALEDLDRQQGGVMSGSHSYGVASIQADVSALQPKATKGFSMVNEFKSYVHDYKDWIFTIAIIAIIDHFFLDGALKEKLSASLGKKLDSSDVKAA